MSAKVLIIDDDKRFCHMLAQQVQRAGHTASVAYTLEDGLGRSKALGYDVLFLDVNLPDGSGLDAIGKFKASPGKPEIIIITGFGDPDGAELAMRNGAWDYLSKGASPNAARMSLARALQYRDSQRAVHTPVALETAGMIGNCPAFKACLDLVAQAADSMANVLISGETGTGKEMLARAIHQNSQRSGSSFVVVDCATLPDTLVESVLFGHEKGAFTGADERREGLVRQADGGTLFLDEVGELPRAMQRAFLRVLQERRFRPVGGKSEVESDFRLVAATNRNLEGMAEAEEFRADLLFRLKGLSIELPPLRERVDDISSIILHYVTKFCRQGNKEPKGFSPDFLAMLMAHHWPGNVRELVHTIEAAIAVAGEEPILYPMHLPPELRARAAISEFGERSDSTSKGHDDEFAFPTPLPPLREIREEFERAYLRRLIDSTQSNADAACRISGLSRARVYGLLRKHGLSLRN